MIPIFSKTTTYVICDTCKATYLSSLRVDDLEHQQGVDVARFLKKETPLISATLAIFALLLCWIPLIGLCLALIAVAASWKVQGWVKTVARIAFAISVLSIAAVGGAIVIDELKRR